METLLTRLRDAESGHWTLCLISASRRAISVSVGSRAGMHGLPRRVVGASPVGLALYLSAQVPATGGHRAPDPRAAPGWTHPGPGATPAQRTGKGGRCTRQRITDRVTALVRRPMAEAARNDEGDEATA